jgi:transcriptional regulator with XRE-family HTH domain
MYSLANSESSETYRESEQPDAYDAPMKLGDRIRKARDDAEMTQGQLAVAVGVTRGAVAQWESDEATPRWAKLHAIARATGAKPSWLIYEEDVGLKVVGEIAVGIWREPSVVFREYIGPIAAHPQYSASAQHLWRVADESIAAVASRGSFLHGIELAEAGIAAQDGDLLVVRRHDNAKIEYTVRYLAVVNGRQFLRAADGVPDWPVDSTTDILDLIIGKWEPLVGRRPFNTYAHLSR